MKSVAFWSLFGRYLSNLQQAEEQRIVGTYYLLSLRCSVLRLRLDLT